MPIDYRSTFKLWVGLYGPAKALRDLKAESDVPAEIFDNMDFSQMHLRDIDPELFFWFITHFSLRGTRLRWTARTLRRGFLAGSFLTAGPDHWHLWWSTRHLRGTLF